MSTASPLSSHETAAADLIDVIASLGRVVVAFSGGVDSSVVAAATMRAAMRSQQFTCIAITARSPSLASWQAELAVRVAGEIGIPHEFVSTDEMDHDGYIQNGADRCYYCKQTLYEFLQPIARTRSAVILSGTNADDLGDHRPGLIAGKQANVHTPLADLGYDKQAVRGIADTFGLSNADLPASPCLSSRIAYNVEVTRERLARIDAAESWLRERGIRELRVRLHAGELARIEVRSDQLSDIIELQRDASLDAAFSAMGFRNVTLDLRGLRSGSMNEALVTLSSEQR